MNRKAITIPLLACALAMNAAARAESAAATDPVRTSFERLLDSRPAPGTTTPLNVTRSDPLLQHLEAALAGTVATPPAPVASSTAERIVAAPPADPLADSFQRMLGHEPTTHSTQIAGAAVDDPLARKIAASLWRGR